MTDYTLTPCMRPALGCFEAYLSSLSAPIDSYLEDHILESQFYRISDPTSAQEVGGYAIHEGAMLTLFYLVAQARAEGQAIFERILREHRLLYALVPTCDELFICHALHRYQSLAIQALFFVDGVPTAPPAAAPRVAYRPAEQSDLPNILVIGADLIDQPEQRIAAGQVHVGHLPDGQLVSLGLVIASQLWPSQASIGMLTHENYRQQGIGTQTIRYLTQTCRSQGSRALAGCGYGHKASQATLQAAGMVPATRLLRFTF